MNWAVRASSALYGFALGVSIAPALQFRAGPDEVLSALKLEGYSPRGVVLQFLIAVLLTAVGAIVAVRVARLLEPHRWAAISYCSALLLAPITLMHYGNVRHVLLLGVAAAAIVLIRRRDPHFTRGDVVLIPVFLSCYIAFIDAGFGKTPAATLARAAIAVFALRVLVGASEPLVASSLALFAQLGWIEPKPAGAIAFIVIFATPFVLLRIRRFPPRRVVYPLIVFLYPLAVLRMTPPFSINFFEDGHSIPVATEIMRGERPYRDILPTHGLIADGLLDLAALEFGHGSLETVLATRLVAGALTSITFYCLVLAATGDAELGLLAAFLAFALTPGTSLWFRPAAGLFALAAAIAGTRLRSRRWFVLAGALVFVAWLVSIDFGVYSFIVTLFAAFRSRALRAFAIGIAAAAIPALIVFAIFGFALDFLRVGFFGILGGHGVYFVHAIVVPEPLRSPALLHHVNDADYVNVITWVVALVASCAALARSPLRARRTDGPWLIGVWMVVVAASYIERGNYYFNPAIAPFIVVAIWALWHRSRPAAIAMTVIVVLLAQPFRHVITWIPQLRKTHAPPLFDASTATSIKAARRFAARLPPSDTFVDFTNSALLYSLLDRDCPLPVVEVANYQTPEGQRGVIQTIERNQHIRAALVEFAPSDASVDGIANKDRAPLVWKYLQTHFAPAFAQDGVVFWVRRR